MKLIYLKTADFDETTVGGSITHTIGMINGFLECNIDVEVLLRKQISLIKALQIELPIKKQRKPAVIGDYIYHLNFRKAATKYLDKKADSYDLLYYRHKLFCKSGVKISQRYKIPNVVEFNSFCYTTYRDMMIPAASIKYGKVVSLVLRITSGLMTSCIKRFDRYVLKNADYIVTVSDVLYKELIEFGVSADKILVLPNGVDPEFFYDREENGNKIKEKYSINNHTPVVGFAGTFGNWHGIEELTEAISDLADDNIEFLLIGDGMMRKKMEETLKGQSNVYFVGKIPFKEMPCYLSACDILVVSNSWNPNDKRPFFGSPTKLFEYMSMGKAIVASDLEQIGEILDNENTALLFPTGNVSAMVSAIRRLAQDKDLRVKIGNAARKEVCDKHTWKINASKVVNKIMKSREC